VRRLIVPDALAALAFKGLDDVSRSCIHESADRHKFFAAKAAFSRGLARSKVRDLVSLKQLHPQPPGKGIQAKPIFGSC
jgi:hypothetical protein